MVRQAARQVTRRSQGQRTPTSRMTAEQCADVDAEQEADVDEDEDLAVATLLDEEEETYEGVDGEVAVVERADEDGEERMPTTTQRLATTTRMTVDWMDSPQFTPDTEPGLNLPEDFHPTCESDFFPSLPNFAKKLKTRNFDTSFGQHSLTFFYYFAHFCFAMQPSFQKMYGLLFAILLPFWVIVQ